jgi:hypothetical protein
MRILQIRLDGETVRLGIEQGCEAVEVLWRVEASTSRI